MQKFWQLEIKPKYTHYTYATFWNHVPTTLYTVKCYNNQYEDHINNW